MGYDRKGYGEDYGVIQGPGYDVYMVVQAGLLYSSEILVVTDEMMTVHEVFHQRIPRRITGMTARRGKGGEWEWASVDTALEVTGICPVRGYVKRWKATIVE